MPVTKPCLHRGGHSVTFHETVALPTVPQPTAYQHSGAKGRRFFYIPADMPHLPYNPSPTVPCVALIARTDPNEQESVVLLPELDRLAPTSAIDMTLPVMSQ